MVFIKDYKGYLIIFLLTLVMGYFLGLMIATTVDYRLKNFIVNLPRPKNKIIVKLDKNKKVLVNKIRKNKAKKNIVEKFTQNARERVFNIENKKEKEMKKMPKYNKQMKDNNRELYAKLYNKSNTKKEKDLKNFNYNAYNMEDSDQHFSFINAKNNSDKSMNNVNKSGKILKNIRKEVANIKKLVPRKKRCPNFKCQKKWQNCTSKHKPIIKNNSFMKKVHKCSSC